jgi:hypothetical protein
MVSTGKAATKPLPLMRRVCIWWKMGRLRYLRSESLQEWAELDRTQARIDALDKAIQAAANEIALLRLAK